MAEVSRYNESSGRWERSSRRQMGNYIRTAAMRGRRRNPAAF